LKARDLRGFAEFLAFSLQNSVKRKIDFLTRTPFIGKKDTAIEVKDIFYVFCK